MLIDWFTVGAQLLNFGVLVLLLRRFLYRPVLDAIDAREADIARRLAEVEAGRQQAAKAEEALAARQQAFERERAHLLEQATDEAGAERDRLLAEARDAADAVTAQHRQAWQHELQRLKHSLGERASRQVFAITRKALADLAGASLEARMVEAFIKRLHALDDDALASFITAWRAPDAAPLVRSAFALPEAERAALRTALERDFGPAPAWRFETDPDLISGIEVLAGGRQLAWGVGPYLEGLEAAVGELIEPAEAA